MNLLALPLILLALVGPPAGEDSPLYLPAGRTDAERLDFSRAVYNNGHDPDPALFFLRLTHYMPERGGTNCAADCSVLASLNMTEDWYGRGAGCPAAMPFGTKIEVISTGEVWWCKDRGTEVRCDPICVIDRLTRQDTPLVDGVFYAIVTFPRHDPPTPIYSLPTFEHCPVSDCRRIETAISPQHPAVDFVTQSGYVYAPGAGTVRTASRDGGCGGTIEIDHQNGATTRLCHFDRILVQPGDEISTGDVLGRIGWSGLTKDGNHVHVAVYWHGLAWNFAALLNEPVSTVGGMVE